MYGKQQSCDSLFHVLLRAAAAAGAIATVFALG